MRNVNQYQREVCSNFVRSDRKGSRASCPSCETSELNLIDRRIASAFLINRALHRGKMPVRRASPARQEFYCRATWRRGRRRGFSAVAQLTRMLRFWLDHFTGHCGSELLAMQARSRAARGLSRKWRTGNVHPGSCFIDLPRQDKVRRSDLNHYCNPPRERSKG